MSDAALNADRLARAGTTLIKIAGAVGPDQLSAPTPCTDFDVRRLVGHLLYWGPSLAAAGRKEALPPPESGESGVDVGDDWSSVLRERVERTVSAWSEPAAWAGTTRMGAADELPAPMVGGMIVGEFVVHGWDLARATGQRPEWDADLLDHVFAEVAATAEMGRAMGAYGPEVAVPPTASTLDRILGLTGRDPVWTPAPQSSSFLKNRAESA